MTVGQEFHAFAASLEAEIQLLKDAEKYLYAVNMGATAIGSGINVPKGYPEAVARRARQAHQEADRARGRHVRGDLGSAGLRRLLVGAQERGDQAVQDRERPDPARLRVRAPGWREIDLPALQPGSSIMPGKVNPVIPELVNVIAFRVMGNDAAVGFAAHSGQLQLNAYEPLEGLAVMESQQLLLNGSLDAAHQVRRRHHGQRESARRATWRPPSASSPRSIRCSATRRPPSWRTRPTRSGKGLLEIIREKNVLTEEQIKDLLDPVKLANLDRSKYPK